MNYTNLSNLPAPLVSAIKNDLYDKVGHISITGLIRPPRMRQLEIRHDEQITEDVADGIWRLIGSIGHAIIERADQDNHLAEERLTMKVLGWTVSGKSDLLDPSMLVSDYKFTSVYSFMFGEKPEWVAQLNLYAELFSVHGFQVKDGQIVAVLRDWSKTRAKREPDYPQVGVVVQPIEIWHSTKRYRFLAERVRLHQEAEKLSDADLPICTSEERWARPDSWAIKKKGGKRATKVFDNKEQAQSVIDHNPKFELEFRPGANVRCESYCSVKDFCNFWNGIKAKKEEAKENVE